MTHPPYKYDQTLKRFRSRTGLQETRHRFRSRLRRWLVMPLLILLMGIILAYYYLTSPPQLIEITTGYLEQFTQCRLEIQEASFSFFDGIRLGKVKAFTTAANGPEYHFEKINDGVVFECNELRLKHDPLAALRGRLEASEIIASGAHLTLISPVETSRLNVAGLFGYEGKPASGNQNYFSSSRTAWPTVRMPNLAFSFYKVDHGQPSPPQETRLDLWAVQRRSGKPQYQIGWQDHQSREGPGRAQLDLLSGEMYFEPGSKPPWLPIEFAIAAMPVSNQTIERWTRLLGLSGEFRLEDLAIGKNSGPLKARGKIILKNASLSVPILEEEELLPNEARFLNFKNVQGYVELQPTMIQAVFEGNLRGRACQTNFIVRDLPAEATHITQASWELSISSDRFLVLRNDPLQFPEEARTIRNLYLLNQFYAFFDPAGELKLSCQIKKEAGRNTSIQLIQATFEALGGNGSYYRFPYRLHDVTGTVVIEAGGKTTVKNLIGRHGSAQVAINGTINGFTGASEIDIQIESLGTPLDSDLFQAMPASYQKSWNLFNPTGLADLRVHVTRPQGAPGTYSKWSTQIIADLRNGQASYVGFPYPLSNLKGRLIIDQGVKVQNVQAQRGETTVVLSGYTKTNSNDQLIIDLDIRADRIPLDETLRTAFSADKQQIWDSFSPSGQFNLTGKIFKHAEMTDTRYQFDVALQNAAITYARLPYPLSDGQGEIQLQPDLLLVNHFSARHDQSQIQGKAEFRWNLQSTSFIQIQAKDLVLDDLLWQCLPTNVAHICKQFNPAGLVNLQGEYHFKNDHNQEQFQHKTIVTPQNNEITYSLFPWKMNELQGQIVITENQVELVNLFAKHDTTTVRLGGNFNYGTTDPSGELKISADNVHLDTSLLEALPPKFQSWWNTLRPQGSVDLDLQRLLLRSSDSDEPLDWEFLGNVKLKNVSLQPGIDISQLQGQIALEAAAGPSQSSGWLKADMDLNNSRLSRIQINHLTGRSYYDESTQLLLLNDLSGECYGGQVHGAVLFSFAPQRPYFDIVSGWNNVALGPLLVDQYDDPSPIVDSNIQGKLNALLAIHVPLDRAAERQGHGWIDIQEAQMYKFPLLFSIFNMMNLAMSEEGAFQNCQFDFTIAGPTMNLQNFELLGRSVALLGSGTLSIPDRYINLSLIAASPYRWLKIPIVTPIVEQASKEIMEVRVLGSLDDPKVSSIPLGGLGGRFKNLLKQPEEKQPN